MDARSLGATESLVDPDTRVRSNSFTEGQTEELSPSGALSPKHGATQDEKFDFWYPSWETWQMRRTLAYWISIMYLEGSVLFTIGAAFSMCDLSKRSTEDELALVATPYLVGGIAFSIGAYSGVLTVVNVPNKDSQKMDWFIYSRAHWNELLKYLSWEPLVGYVSYVIGAFFFNINTAMGYVEDLTPQQEKLYVWLPGILGSMLFTFGGYLECHHNNAWRFKYNDIVHWLSWCNFLGGILFLLAATCGIAAVEDSKWWVDFPYLLGSIFFMFGALLALWMWKGEHYGLGLVSEINIVRKKDPKDFVLTTQAQYGCGRSSVSQLPWLWLYIINSSASVLDVALAVQEIQHHGSISGDEKQSDSVLTNRMFTALLNFFLSHGILLLGSVVHHVPTARPHNWLLIYMRILLFFYTLNSWYSVALHIQKE